MAKMIPEILSADIINNPKRQGEVKVYNTLLKRLGNDWTVFYSVAWLGKVLSSSDRRDGETDFIIANPQFGIVIVEVKGGQEIEYNGIAGQWASVNKKGTRNIIKDPFNQARDNKYSLKNEIKSWRGWERGLGNVNICHIVIFPDVSSISGVLPLHAKKEITVLEDDLSNISNKLISAISYSCNSYKTDVEKTRDLITAIKNNIAPPLVMKRKLSNLLTDDDNVIITLTENQYFLLRAMQSIRRVSISGCAGSGKTLLAMKKSQMSALTGNNTLLCCYNTLLGEKFSTFASDNIGLTGGTFHSIVSTILINDLKIDYSSIKGILYDDNKLIDIFLSNNLPEYDAIIIDETQDFSFIQLEIIEMLLSHDGILYCFWDNNQRLLRSDFKLPKNVQQFNLDMNLRNTRKIFEEVKKYYYQDMPIYNNGPEGPEVKIKSIYNPLRPKELKQKLTNEINELVHSEGVKITDITVLTFKSKDSSILNDFAVPGIEISAFSNNSSCNSVKIETVRRFKGLESPVVILTELDDFNAIKDNELWENLCYVAMSRARNYLIIIPPDSLHNRIVNIGT